MVGVRNSHGDGSAVRSRLRSPGQHLVNGPGKCRFCLSRVLFLDLDPVALLGNLQTKIDDWQVKFHVFCVRPLQLLAR